MSEIGSANETCPHALKAKLLKRGIVKFPVNVHGIYVDKGEHGLTTITARQNEVVLSFVFDKEACQHLAALLTGES
jgi:hypothetical protein